MSAFFTKYRKVRQLINFSIMMYRHTYTFFSELNLKLYADIRFYFQTLSSGRNVIFRPRVVLKRSVNG